MLTAILSDIHGNLEAFEACLADARRRGAERFVFLGDYVGYGADPGPVLDRVMSLVEAGAPAILGNHDAAVAGSDDAMNPLAQAAIRWTRGQLSPAQRGFLESLPLRFEESEYLFVHANAWNPAGWAYVVGRPQAERSLAASPLRITFCGHVHVPALYQQAPGRPACHHRPVAGTPVPLLRQRRWLVVLGAVGQPRDGSAAACYALLRPDEAELTFIRVPYDIDAAARKILAAGLPPQLAERLYHGS